MHMETAAGNKIRPDVYLNTGKATALAVIKLMEALAACYGLWFILSKPEAIPEAVDAFYMGLAIPEASRSSLAVIFRSLYGFLALIAVSGLLSAIVDGFACFFTRVSHKGSGLVSFSHRCSFIVSIVSLVLAFGVIWRYFYMVMRFSQSTRSVSFADIFVFLGAYEALLYIIIVFGSLWIMAAYHLYVARVMSSVKKEIKAGEILPPRKKNRLGREALWLCGILTASVVLSIVQLVSRSSALSDIAAFLKPVEILSFGSNAAAIAVCALLVLKFFLVSRCSNDFDAVHQS